MSLPRPTLAKAVALKSLEWAVRFWPEETRDWGQALLAETYGINHPVEALFWTLGAITVFLRSHLSHLFTLLRLPPGRTAAALPVGANGPRFPHNPRFVTAFILLTVALLLLLPAGREAISIVSSSWTAFEATSRDSRAFEKIALHAERTGDAHVMAFAAMVHSDPHRASVLADRAVSIDPSLVWIYASRFRRPEDTPTNKTWLSRLRNSDPDNAFVYFVSAEQALDAQTRTAIDSANQLVAHSVDAAMGSSEWGKQMNLAFEAPRYDSYLKRHLDLTREGWTKAPNAPASLVAYSVWSHHVPDLSQIRAYADMRLRQARSAASAGDASSSEQIANQVAAFGGHMRAGCETDIERLIALEINRRGLAQL